MNDQIDVKSVLLVDDEGNKLGVMPVEDALERAAAKSLDLVEVAPNGKPVVCKMLDYGKYSYHEKKKRTEARAKVRQVSTKMVKFRPNTFEGDYKTKMGRIRKFLGMGDKVKVVMQFRGREIIHAKNSYDLFRRITEEIEGDGTVDAAPTSEGRFIHMVLAPVAQAKAHVNGEARQAAKKNDKDKGDTGSQSED